MLLVGWNTISLLVFVLFVLICRFVSHRANLFCVDIFLWGGEIESNVALKEPAEPQTRLSFWEGLQLA